MLTENDITLTLMEVENTFSRENLSEQQIKLKREAVLKNIVEALRQQRNKSDKKYNFFKKEQHVSSAILMDQMYESEKKLKKCEEQIMQECQNKYEEENNIGTQTQSEQNNILQQLINKQEEYL
ncbi:hypothetical protein Zmor_013989 [Zophobas morio]|uniref:Uncharacterized protein n=1 Tax=Zophobas morio TaxID=2755281 RepID=A0AA38MG77_9CUCU|nr:hypothetical protein Zmor_013989 [Zophobas morio]